MFVCVCVSPSQQCSIPHDCWEYWCLVDHSLELLTNLALALNRSFIHSLALSHTHSLSFVHAYTHRRLERATTGAGTGVSAAAESLTDVWLLATGRHSDA
jgi:hypothetical protein